MSTSNTNLVYAPEGQSGSAKEKTGYTRTQNILLLAGAILTLVSWVVLTFIRPEIKAEAEWHSLVSNTGSAFALVGYGVAGVLLILAVVPNLPIRTLALVPVALVINIVLGQLVGTMPLPVPLYIDSIGTILIAAIAGARAGIATGVLSTLVWTTINPTIICFAGDYAMIGFLAGLAPWRRHPAFVAVSGFLTGVVSAFMAAPIASFVFGGTAGTGTGMLVTILKYCGFGPQAAVYAQSLISDPLDKLIIFLLVAALLAALPERVLRTFGLPSRTKAKVNEGQELKLKEPETDLPEPTQVEENVAPHSNNAESMASGEFQPISKAGQATGLRHSDN